MANFCENCGSPLREGARFCENCGAPVKQSAPMPPADTAPATPTAPSSSASASTAVGAGTAAMAGTAAAAGLAANQNTFAGPRPQPETPVSGPEPQHDMPPRPQPVEEPEPFQRKVGTQNTERPAFTPSVQQPEPASDFKRFGKLARGGTGPRYEADEDIQSLFLRYDNRLNRKRYILRALALWAAVFVITFILGLVARATGIKSLTVLGTVISVASAIPGFMLVIRRLHDLNRPGWWCIGCIIPLVNFVLAVYMLFFKGTDGPNQYGPDPLEVQD
mgnify:FL=1